MEKRVNPPNPRQGKLARYCVNTTELPTYHVKLFLVYFGR